MLAGLTLFGLRRESAPATQTPAAAPQPVSLDSRTIAVLPFRASTPGETNEALALVVTDLVRTRLATFKGVVVIAGGSTARMADAHLDARETGRKLNARFLLHGSAARAGDQIRTEVELVDAASGAQLWSTSFDSSVTDAAALRERIVERVASTLHVPAEPAVSNAKPRRDQSGCSSVVRTRPAVDVEPSGSTTPTLLSNSSGARRSSIRVSRGVTWRWARRCCRSATSEGTQSGAHGLAGSDKAFDRALELDPALGEAWIERAVLNAGIPSRPRSGIAKDSSSRPATATGTRTSRTFCTLSTAKAKRSR